MVLRTIFISLAILTGLLLGILYIQLHPPESAPPPDVILISVDTLRLDHTGSGGSFRPVTPNMDALSRISRTFTCAVSQSSWTLPSHMSLMTSTFPRMHGVYDHSRALPESGITLAKVLKDHGYLTAGFVSWVYLGKRFGFARGFDVYEELYSHNNLAMSAGTGAFSAEEITDRVIRWLTGMDQDESPPFFLFVHYYDPHMSYRPPPPYNRMYDPDYQGSMTGEYDRIKPYIKYLREDPVIIDPADRHYIEALYDGEIRYTDSQIGRLLRHIDMHRDLDDCWVVIVSDHGEEFFEHGSMEGH